MPLSAADIERERKIAEQLYAPHTAATTPKKAAGLAPLPLSGRIGLVGKAFTAPLLPIATGTARAAGTGVSNVFDLLNRPHEAVAATVTGGFGKLIPTLMHGQSQRSQDQTRAELRNKLHIGKFYDSIKNQDSGHARQGVIDFLLDAGLDPATYAGGTGLLKHVVEAGGARALPAAVNALSKMHATENLGHMAQGVEALYDFTHFKGPIRRALALSHGEQGAAKFAGLKSINNARLGKAQDLQNVFLGKLNEINHGLSPEQKGQLFNALHTGTESSLPPELQRQAHEFSVLTDTIAHLYGTRALRSQLAEHGYQVPEWAQRFDTHIRSLMRPSQYRKNYVPTAHDMDTIMGLESRPGSLAELDQRIRGESLQDAGINPKSGPFRTLLDATHAVDDAPRTQTTKGLKNIIDKNLEERGAHAHLLDPEMQTKVIEARLRTGAKALAARDAEGEVSRLFGVGGFQKAPAAAQQFFKETYNMPDGKSFWTGLAKSLIDVPKIGLFALPFRHMANIGTLSILADPSLGNVFGTAGKFARLLLAGMDADKRAQLLGKAAKYGVTGTPSVDQRAGWLGKIPVIGDIYKASNHILWTFDDAAKATRFQRLLDHYKGRGMKETDAAYRAADEVGAELIDYSNRSPLTQALAYIAPFATYRSKLPGAIAKVVTQHPERVLAAGRMSPELVGDEQQASGGKVGKSYLPMPDLLRGVDDPLGYARSTAGYPFKMLGSVLGHSSDNYWTYGQKPDLKFLANQTIGSFPGGNQALTAIHQNEFPNQGDISGALSGQTGFNLKKGPTIKNLLAAAHVAQQKAVIDNLRRQGKNADADYWQKRLDGYLRYNHLYEK